ncbi:MAG: Asp23/Gls24 family envelope stress response protein [Synergistaceae bacterium]|nr:Asp23/Gls24 family envelope stress response protein [Synergistaceae bacterium]
MVITENDETQSEDNNVSLKEKESKTHQPDFDGKVRVSEDVIAQLATKALNSIEGVFPSNPGLMANLRLGRKTVNGVRISVSDAEEPEIVIDAYILVKYGLRIPDICWDVQESIKEQVEQLTGYTIKSVNIYVQGISFAENKSAVCEETELSGISKTSTEEI